jgi:tagaturonate epimerase
METRLELGKYSVGVGDRFEHEAEAQLQACIMALDQGVEVVPVWNKSNREHLIIGSDPAGTRASADRAVANLGWNQCYFVDADHIRLDTVDRFIPHADFYTIDVADYIGQPAGEAVVAQFISAHPELSHATELPGVFEALHSAPEVLGQIARHYLLAVNQAARVYHHIAAARQGRAFVTEVSLDETDKPQSALDLLVLLAALADQGVPIQTIAPRFCGAFHKGIDYVGEVDKFEKQFRAHLAVIALAVIRYALPKNLKLSLHSGSDKFSLYAAVRSALADFDAGLHLKTAGTTWLEEFIGLVEGGGEGLVVGKEIAVAALERLDELCAPYQNVISINRSRLPTAESIRQWSPAQFADAVRHDTRNPTYNSDLRQLLHVSYKLAAERRAEFDQALETCRAAVNRNVTGNLFERHLRPVFIG